MSEQYRGRAVVDLLKQHGYFGLTGYDGCECGECELLDIRISTSCRKSGGSGDFLGTVLRVSSSHMDIEEGELKLVAEEVRHQLEDSNPGMPVKILHTTWEQDNAT